MTEIEMKQTFWGLVRATFARGLVVLVPLVITVWVLNILFSAIDGTTSWIFRFILQKEIPGLGFITTVVLIFIVGVLSRNLIGRAMFKFFERILFSIPVARNIYSAMKDLIGAFGMGSKSKSFRNVVLVEYPRQGLFTIGFMTNEITVQQNGSKDEMVSVYLPNPPNPTSGFLILVPRQSMRVLDMSVEDGLKLVLSGGIVSSGSISVK